MSVYKYVISKKIVREPLRIVNKMILSCSNEKSFLHKFNETSLLEDILNLLKENNCEYVELIEVSQLVFEEIINTSSSFVECIDLFNCNLELASLEKCEKLKTIDIFGNQKMESLWNLCKNKNLSRLIINDCENIKDINGIINSSLVELEIKNGFKTVPDVLNIKIADFNVFSSLSNLKKLTLFVLENEDKEKDLLALSKLTHLESLYLPREYFTFEEFAWLKSKLKDTKNIDCIYYIAKDPANEKVVAMIIGRGEPGWLYDDGTDYKEYHDRYAELIKKFK